MEGGLLPAVVHVPQQDGALLSAAGQGLPVRGERHRKDGGPALALEGGLLPAAGRVPQPDAAIVTALARVFPSGENDTERTQPDARRVVFASPPGHVPKPEIVTATGEGFLIRENDTERTGLVHVSSAETSRTASSSPPATSHNRMLPSSLPLARA